MICSYLEPLNFLWITADALEAFPTVLRTNCRSSHDPCPPLPHASLFLVHYVQPNTVFPRLLERSGMPVKQRVCKVSTNFIVRLSLPFSSHSLMMCLEFFRNSMLYYINRLKSEAGVRKQLSSIIPDLYLQKCKTMLQFSFFALKNIFCIKCFPS